MHSRSLAIAAISAIVSTSTVPLRAQHYVEVAVESAAAAADFDSNILGHVRVDQSRRVANSTTYRGIANPTGSTGEIRLATTNRGGVSIFFKALNSTPSVEVLDGEFTLHNPEAFAAWRFRDDSGDTFRGSERLLTAALSIDPDDVDGGSIGPLVGEWQAYLAFSGSVISQWRVESVGDGGEVLVPAISERRIRLRNVGSSIRRPSFPGTSEQIELEVTVDGDTLRHDGIIPLDPANDLFAGVHMLATDPSYAGRLAVALFSIHPTASRPQLTGPTSGIYVWPSVGLVPMGQVIGGSGISLGLLPVGVLPPGTTLFVQGAVITPNTARGFVASEGVELRMETGATRPANSAPVAHAGADQTVIAGDWVGLDGLLSTDRDSNQRVEFGWQQLPNGAPGATLSDTSSEGPFFVAPDVTQPTELQFEVTVTDGLVTDTDQVSIFVEPATPEFTGRRSLAPYRDSLTKAEATHLLRRAGFGGKPAEIEAAVTSGLTATLDRLFNVVPTPEIDAAMIAITGDPRRAGDTWGRSDTQYRRAFAIAMINSPNQLIERMAYFWHDLHATAMVNGAQNEEATIGRHLEMLRRNMNPTGTAWRFDYREHLLALSRDGLMLRFLDGDVNIAGNPNENYSREFFELYTLGEPEVSGVRLYSERDVLEAARAFTGWRMVRTAQVSSSPVFDLNRHDQGSKNVLGVTDTFDDAGIVDLVLNSRQTEAAAYLVRNLFDHFVGIAPTANQVAGLSNTLINTNWQVPRVVRRILASEVMFSSQARFARIKNPVEFATTFHRALQADGVQTTAQRVDLAAERMGHLLFEPPSPAGWDDGLAWISEGSLALRLFAFADMAISRDVATDTVSHSAAGTIAYLANRLDLDMSLADMKTYVEYANSSVDLAGDIVEYRFDQRARYRVKAPRLAGLLGNHPSFQRN